MEPAMGVELASVLSRLLDGALGEAGRRVWDGFVTLIGNFGRGDAAGDRDAALTVIADEAPDPDARAQELAGLVQRWAASDPEFAEALRRWWAGATAELGDEYDVRGSANVISGSVHGPSVQARDVSGSINVGRADSSE